MTLVRWDPFLREFGTLAERMNRILNGTFRTGEGDTDFGVWAPPVDIYEQGDNLILKAELPGLKNGDIDIRVENNLLTLRGQRKREQEVKEDGYLRTERSFGSFSRSFTLPATVAVDKISAGYQDGILTVTLPKAEEAKPKQIQIKAA